METERSIKAKARYSKPNIGVFFRFYIMDELQTLDITHEI
ncbi:hypothetical protein A1122_21562 (plasmid) [Yersinia pestis A1122]|nr:hypothetical protein A1122_21562 [Yersinia pestis A1122]